eukprot:CAMPEP_0175107116 /NCGR_PEP_ID=MMETSP0086_2-20121207/11675_1 /TAXON_ID=136419 /ORGANISM="Unknown Unknown, Strain D1" /LENGTH=47 /DNA_ID= /DNA_START= /DNA_END= /DNA_ORIENTATION=
MSAGGNLALKAVCSDDGSSAIKRWYISGRVELAASVLVIGWFHRTPT